MDVQNKIEPKPDPEPKVDPEPKPEENTSDEQLHNKTVENSDNSNTDTPPKKSGLFGLGIGGIFGGKKRKKRRSTRRKTFRKRKNKKSKKTRKFVRFSKRNSYKK
jgi:hypothetical protein